MAEYCLVVGESGLIVDNGIFSSSKCLSKSGTIVSDDLHTSTSDQILASQQGFNPQLCFSILAVVIGLYGTVAAFNMARRVMGI